MSGKSLDHVMRRVRELAAPRASRGLSDRELLERFLDANDEAAFTALVERHGPMVLGVCRRALRNHHDAEDACQATFLVLARHAASVRKKTAPSCWLHGGGVIASVGSARDPKSPQPPAAAAAKAEGDEAYIRRISLDLRGREPSPAEVHFFVASREVPRAERRGPGSARRAYARPWPVGNRPPRLQPP